MIEGTKTNASQQVQLQTTEGSSTTNGATPASLPDPLERMAMSDDMIAQITAMMAKSFREDRKDAKKLQAVEEKRIMQETAKRIDAMHKKADDILKAGVIKGLTQAGAGALQMGSSIMAMSMTAGADESIATAGQSSNQAIRDQAKLQTEQTLQTAQGLSGAGSGAAQLTSGSGVLWASAYESDQVDHEADAASHEGQAAQAKSRADEYGNEVDDNRQLLKKVADFLKTIREGQNASQQAAIRRA